MSEYTPLPIPENFITMYTPAWMFTRWNKPEPHVLVLLSVKTADHTFPSIGYLTNEGDWMIFMEGQLCNIGDEKMSRYYKVYAWAEFPQACPYDEYYIDGGAEDET